MTDSRPIQLVDGSSPANAQNLFDRLSALGIHATTIKHPRVFTVEQSKALRGKIPGCHTKNLLLRNKKGVMWLIVCLEKSDRQSQIAGNLPRCRPFFFRESRAP